MMDNGKINGFLEVVYDHWRQNAEGDDFNVFFAPFIQKLKELFSPEMYAELEEMFASCVRESDRFFAIEGMKLAIQIMDGTYIPMT